MADEDAAPLVCAELAVFRCEAPAFFCVEFVLGCAVDFCADLVVVASLEEVCCRALAEGTTTHMNIDARIAAWRVVRVPAKPLNMSNCLFPPFLAGNKKSGGLLVCSSSLIQGNRTRPAGPMVVTEVCRL
jgi:hypothetical protein